MTMEMGSLGWGLAELEEAALITAREEELRGTEQVRDTTRTPDQGVRERIEKGVKEKIRTPGQGDEGRNETAGQEAEKGIGTEVEDSTLDKNGTPEQMIRTRLETLEERSSETDHIVQSGQGTPSKGSGTPGQTGTLECRGGEDPIGCLVYQLQETRLKSEPHKPLIQELSSEVSSESSEVSSESSEVSSESSEVSSDSSDTESDISDSETSQTNSTVSKRGREGSSAGASSEEVLGKNGDSKDIHNQ